MPNTEAVTEREAGAGAAAGYKNIPKTGRHSEQG